MEMIKYIEDNNIFEILGLENLDKDQQAKLLADMVGIVITKAIANFLSSGDVSLADINRLEKKLDQASDPIKFQEFLIEKYPKITDYIKVESYNFKKGALLQQIEAYGKSLENEEKNEETEYNSSAIKTILEILDKDDNEKFEENLQLYKKLKQNIKI